MTDALKTRALGLMRRGGAYLSEEGDHYAIRLHPDRRRKPLLCLTSAAFKSVFEGMVLHRLENDRLTLAKADTRAPACTPAKPKPIIEDPILYLRALKDQNKRPLFSDSHLKALYVLMRDHAVAFGGANLTLNWARLGMPKSGPAFRDNDAPLWRIEKQKAVRDALNQLGPMAGLFERLCLEGTSHSLENGVWGLPKGAFMAKMIAALDRLVDFYAQS